jgi:AraC-like DNA-binding protein
MLEASPLFAPLKAFRLPDSPSLLTRSAYGSALALLDVSGPANHGMTASIPKSTNYLVQLQLLTCVGEAYFLNGKPIETSDHGEGAIQFHDLRQDPRVELVDPFHILAMNVPLAALGPIGDELGVPKIDELKSSPGQCHRDPVIEHLLRSMRPALASAGEVSALFLDHVTTALCVHLVQQYAGVPQRPRTIRGGLAPWQQKIAKELLNSDLKRDIALLEVALACRLSIRHFTRAFKQSVGMPAHQFRLMCRIDHARLLLRLNHSHISDIAAQCGFANQSHFTKCFHQCTGQSPGDWRRTYGTSPIISLPPPMVFQAISERPAG